MNIGKILSSATGGLLTGTAEKLFDNYSSAKAATKAFDREKWLYENRYQMQVADLKAAGLNPALAYGQSAPLPGVQMAQTSRGGVGSVVSAMSTARQVAAQTKSLEADANYKNALAATEHNRPENVIADTALKRQDTAYRVLQGGLVSAQSDVARETAELVVAQAAATRAAGVHSLAAAEQARAGAALARARIPEIVAHIANLDADSMVKRVDNVLKELDYQKQFVLMPYLVALGKAESYSAQLSLAEKEAMAAKWRSAVGKSVLPWAREVSSMAPGILLGIGKK